MVSSAVHADGLLSLIFLGLSLEVFDLLLSDVSGHYSDMTQLCTHCGQPSSSNQVAFSTLLMSTPIVLLDRASYLVRVGSDCGVRTKEVLKLLEDNVSGETITRHPPLLLVRGCLRHDGWEVKKTTLTYGRMCSCGRLNVNAEVLLAFGILSSRV